MTWTAHDAHLLAAAAAALIGLVLLVSVAKLHPFVALVLASGALGIAAGLPPDRTVAAFQKGVGETLGSVGVIIALGAMLGKLLEVSGGADRIVSRLVARTSPSAVPWTMAIAAMAIGLPMFFEVGVVLLMPVVAVVARRTGQPRLRVGLPALAGLSVLHGLVPPHPAPLVAATLLGADVGRTLTQGLLVAIPTVVVAGPLFGAWVGRLVAVGDPTHERETAGHVEARELPAVEGASMAPRPPNAPGFWTSLATLLLPVALMVFRAVVDVATPKGRLQQLADFIGQAVVALLLGVLFALFPCGFLRGIDSRRVGALLGESLAPVAAIVMIVGAGGGFKQTLVESGVGDVIGTIANGSSLPPLLLAWLVAVAIRLATGSATVATVTASGIVAPLGSMMRHVDPSLLTLSIGCGSLFFSHVSDAGFWLVKEYFGMSVMETLASWSLMETVISVVGLTCVLVLGAIR
ncbi:MAG TPA: gluconate:H+ symporter [Polyangiaceae bacterium]|nr:gluconate:H+ symporter [Polyangiaceae bacterium]